MAVVGGIIVGAIIMLAGILVGIGVANMSKDV